MLTEKNATIGPSEASTVTITPSEATSNRTTVPSAQPRPDQCIEYIKRRKRHEQRQVEKSGTLTMLASTCIGVRHLSGRKTANVPMQTP